MDKVSISVLELLLFPEHFNDIVEECRSRTTRHIVGDVLKTLLHDGLVSPLLKKQNGEYERSIGYDSDDMEAFYYQITAKGIDVLNAQNKVD